MGRIEKPSKNCPWNIHLTDRIESQIQVADSFKQELYNDFPPLDINDISTEETSGDEYEVNEMSCVRKWGNNNFKKSIYKNNQNYSNRSCYSKVQETKTNRKWDEKEEDLKIPLLQGSSHFIPVKFSDSFFRQFDLAMKLKKNELKKQS